MFRTIQERVATRFIQAGLEQELSQRMNKLFSSPYDDGDAAEVAKWFKNTFRFDTAKTPPGQKKLKELASKFHWHLNAGSKQNVGGDVPKVWRGNESNFKYAADIWAKELKPLAADLVRYFSDEGIKVVPKEVEVGGHTYLNLVGFDGKALGKIIQSLESVFDQVKDWRRKALSGLKVALADPRHFHGTAGGKYKSSEDTLYVRATPAVLKRTRGTYGAFDYILVHELGHRYDRKHGTKVDFDQQEWWTTPYSKNGGDEPFAELFALSNFGMTGTWGPVLEKFEQIMS